MWGREVAPTPENAVSILDAALLRLYEQGTPYQQEAIARQEYDLRYEVETGEITPAQYGRTLLGLIHTTLNGAHEYQECTVTEIKRHGQRTMPDGAA